MYIFSKPFYKKWWFWLIIAFVILASIPSVEKNDNTNNAAETAEPSAETSTAADNPASPAEKKTKLTKDDYKAQCAAIPYNDIARNPDDYTGQKAMFKGQVVQVQEGFWGNDVVLRINVSQNEYGFWDDTIYVDYQKKKDNESRILEEDIVTVYGEIKGIKTYTAILGNQITIPHIKAKYIEISQG